MTPFMKFRMSNKGKGAGIRADGSTLWLYDVIASDDDEAMFWGGISPRQFIDALSQTAGPVTLRINSPGGSVFGAQAMVAAMRSHAEPITARVDSLAASAASVIATEAATLEMVEGAMLMVHRAWGMAIGNEQDMRETADLLAKIDGTIADTYARRSGKDKAEWLDVMAAETWFEAQEAVAAGLADRLITENLQRPAARWDLSAYKAAPWQPEAVDHAPEPDVTPQPKTDLRATRQRQLAARLAATGI
jgi:ATP-dependent Clp protease protease subunit